MYAKHQPGPHNNIFSATKEIGAARTLYFREDENSSPVKILALGGMIKHVLQRILWTE